MFIIYCFSYYLLTLFASTPFKMISQVSVPVSDFPAISLLRPRLDCRLLPKYLRNRYRPPAVLSIRTEITLWRVIYTCKLNPGVQTYTESKQGLM